MCFFQNLRQVTVNDLPVGRSVDETLRLVQAFQFTDENGEGEFLNMLLFSGLVISRHNYSDIIFLQFALLAGNLVPRP